MNCCQQAGNQSIILLSLASLVLSVFFFIHVITLYVRWKCVRTVIYFYNNPWECLRVGGCSGRRQRSLARCINMDGYSWAHTCSHIGCNLIAPPEEDGRDFDKEKNMLGHYPRVLSRAQHLLVCVYIHQHWIILMDAGKQFESSMGCSIIIIFMCLSIPLVNNLQYPFQQIIYFTPSNSFTVTI